jgi:cytochrome c peroxidase
MHDGRFPTLDAVLEHYSSGGKSHPNKDVRVQPMHFTPSEKAALVAFLKTLTDRHFLDDPKFSDPFK